MEKSDNLNKVAGCIFGGAAGDALGNPLEFLNVSEIRRMYGSGGPEHLPLEKGQAQITDDTQMTILTAEAVIPHCSDKEFMDRLWPLYREWAHYQCGYDWPGEPEAANSFRFMKASRAPGVTCLRSLMADGAPATFDHPLNGSKGCGGIMRVAPVAFEPLGYGEIAYRAVMATACTHGHPLGYLSSAVQACAIARSIRTADSLDVVVRSAFDDVDSMVTSRPFAEAASRLVVEGETVSEFMGDLREKIELSISLAHSNKSDQECLVRIGEGWVAEETLGIAVFSALRYEDDFRQALRTSVCHDGDSDSCGAVTGNLLGVRAGLDSVREAFDLEKLECYQVLMDLSRRLSESMR